MGFPLPSAARPAPEPDALRRLAEVSERSRALAAALPSNRTYIDTLRTAQTDRGAQGAIA